MKTDIEIAQEAEMMPIKNVAEQLGITEDDIELYGKYKAKISNEYYEKIKDNEDGKLILVTAINPTPAGEGKTTVTVGLGEAFGQLNKKAVIALREPSLGPCFGIKGGAAGGGYAQVVPMEEYLNMMTTVGASGAVYAILLAFGMLFPNNRLFIFPLPFPIKAKFFVIGYAAIELWSGLANSAGDNVAHFAHLGGMLFGLILILYWRKKSNNNGTYYS